MAQEPREQGDRQKRDRCRSDACHRVASGNPQYIRLARATAGTVAYGCGRSTRPCKMPRLPQGHTRAARCSPARNTSERPRSASSGQGARHLRPRRRAADGRHRSHLGVRLRARLGHSRQGQGADAAVGVLVRAARATSCRTTARPRTCASIPAELQPHADVLDGPVDARAQDEPGADRVRGARATCRARAGRNTSRTGAVCGVALPPGLRESDRLPEPIFTPATKATSGHDVNISEAEAGRLVGDDARRRAARADAGALRLRRGARRVARHHPRRHQVRVRPDRRGRDHPHRRGDDARLVALLAAAISTRPGGPQPSFDKQFVRDYLEQIRWNKQPPVPSLPDDVVAAHAREIRRGVSPPHRHRSSRDGRCSEQLERLVDEMVTQGRPLRGRAARVREALHRPRPRQGRRQPLQGGRPARHAPQHAQPEDRPSTGSAAPRLTPPFVRASTTISSRAQRSASTPCALPLSVGSRGPSAARLRAPGPRPLPDSWSRRHMKVRPLHDRIIVQRIEEGEQKVGGIIIPDTRQGKAAAGQGHRRRRGQGQGRRQAPAARRQGRRHHPVRQVLGPGDQD